MLSREKRGLPSICFTQKGTHTFQLINTNYFKRIIISILCDLMPYINYFKICLRSILGLIQRGGRPGIPPPPSLNSPPGNMLLSSYFQFSSDNY